jgi:RNA recognition motif-containing protein
MSKGCGIVEYETAEMAQKAIHDMSNKNLMGRLIYVREVRLQQIITSLPNLLMNQYRTARPSRASAEVVVPVADLVAWAAHVADSRAATAADFKVVEVTEVVWEDQVDMVEDTAVECSNRAALKSSSKV